MKTKTVARAASCGVTITAPVQGTTFVVIEGITPLVMHKFGQRIQDEIEADQTAEGKQAKVRKPKNIEQEYGDCFHYLPGHGATDKMKVRYAFPANGIKRAMVAACREIDTLHMTDAKQLFFVSGHEPGFCREFIEIFGTPERRRDVVRLPNKSMDLRYRPYFFPWSGLLRLRWNLEKLSLETVLNLLARAGQSVGIGDRRPSCEGSDFGQWKIAEANGDIDKLTLFKKATRTKRKTTR